MSIRHNTKTRKNMLNIILKEGTHLTWQSTLNGKIITLIGNVSSIQDSVICCIGKCVKTGNWYRDYIHVDTLILYRL